MRDTESFATNLGIPTDSLYFVVGFSKGNDISMMQYFGIPYVSLDRFRTAKGWYNFSVKSCEAAMQEDGGVFRV